MSLPVFPTLPGLTYTSVKTPAFDTLVNRGPNAYEVRIQQTVNPVWTWTLIFDFLHDFLWGGFQLVSELRTLMGFFTQMGGKAGSFLYTDPDDNYVGPVLSTASWLASNYYPLNFGIVTAGTSGTTIPTFNDVGGTSAFALTPICRTSKSGPAQARVRDSRQPVRGVGSGQLGAVKRRTERELFASQHRAPCRNKREESKTMTTSENPQEPISTTTQPEAPAPQAQSADPAPSPKPIEGVRARVLVNGV